MHFRDTVFEVIPYTIQQKDIQENNYLLGLIKFNKNMLYILDEDSTIIWQNCNHSKDIKVFA